MFSDDAYALPRGRWSYTGVSSSCLYTSLDGRRAIALTGLLIIALLLVLECIRCRAVSLDPFSFVRIQDWYPGLADERRNHRRQHQQDQNPHPSSFAPDNWPAAIHSDSCCWLASSVRNTPINHAPWAYRRLTNP